MCYNVSIRKLALLLILTAVSAFSQEAIFNGEDLKGWTGSDIWKIEEGAIIAEIKNGQRLNKNEFLYFNEELSDFDLTIQYKITGPSANSGIQIRSSKDKNGHAVGYQCDLDSGKTWLGRIYDEHARGLIVERGTLTTIGKDGKKHAFPFRNAKDMKSIAKQNDWNEYKIIAKGHRIEIHINGTHFSTLEDYQENEADLKGLLALQIHSGKGPAKVFFKDIKLNRYSTNNNLKTEAPKPSPILRHLVKNPASEGNTKSTPNRMYVPEGFKVEEIVSPERVKQPIAFTFDSKGRIWVAEAYAYPRRQPAGQGKDRLVIFEDKDGDGTFESQKVFADNLNLISGFEIGYGGVFVGASPEFLFIPDRDGDDKPDGEYKVLLDGWDTRDTHETQNSFLWGHDGWLYGNHGVFNNSMVGKPGTPRSERISVKAAVWRYHPVTHKFEIYSHGGSNQWGLDYNADGALFMTHCRSSWGKGPVSQVIRDGHYWTQNNSSHADFIAAPKKGWRFLESPINNTLFSAAAYGHGKGGAGDNESRSIFGGHSHVGTMVYLGNNWPQEYRNQLYTHNLHGQQMNREFLQRFDSGFLSHSYGRDQLYVKDNQYLAVDLKYGPDGAVYSIDWFDKQHCHTNKHEVWDRTNGGVYRMQYSKTFKAAKFDNLQKINTRALIEYLDHENEWFSRMAQHVLRQRYAKEKIDDDNLKLIKERLFDKFNKNRFRAMTALYGVHGLTKEIYSKLLEDKDEVIRTQAVHLLTEQKKEFSSQFKGQLIKLAENDPSSSVRLKLAGASQNRLNEELALNIITILSRKESDATDRFIPKMLWFAYSKFAKKDFTKAFEMADKSKLPLFRKSVYWYAAKHDKDLFMKQLLQVKNNDHLFEYLAVLSQVLEGQKQLIPPSDWLTVRKRAEKANPKSYALTLLDKIFDQNAVKVNEHKEQIARGKAGFALCAACHNPGKDMPGPSLEEVVAAYGNKADMIKWIKKPGKKRQKYPQMPPFDKLSDEALDDIATYLLSLRKPEIVDFKKQMLTDQYYSEGANIADFNNDGKVDIVSGPYWYEAPDYKKKHEIYKVHAFSKISGYANSFFTFPYDFNKDGWQDILAWGLPNRPATVYVNPQGKSGHWQAHKVFSAVGHESPVFGDIDNDGQPELLCTHKGILGFAEFDKDKPFEEWKWHPVGQGRFAHGLGYGDINGDSRHDIMGPKGWWEQPEKAHSQSWKFHKVNFGRGGAQMYAYDVDGDGDNDVITSLVAHGYGLAWFEQDNGKFTQHTIMGSKPEDNKYGVVISQLHALELKDINGDGLKDIITGKCYYAHNGRDPGAEAPSKMIYFELSRKNGVIDFIPREMDDDSGLGRLIAVGDVDGDTFPDVVSGNKKGAFLFTQSRKTVSEKEYLANLPKIKSAPKNKTPSSGLIEGERIKIVKYTGQTSVQNMRNWKAHKWSGDSQLWWRNGKLGDKLEMTFNATEAGNFNLEIALTKANDYAKIQLYLNGKKVMEPIDLYNSDVIHSGAIKLGQHNLKKGPQKFTIEIIGANPKALKRYMVGLDYIKVTKK